MCDLGCGSGETALELARRGLEVHAVDSSPVFCEAVRASARRARLGVVVHCDDMRDFTLPRPVDLVLAEFASLNNLADRRDLPRVFNAVARALGLRVVLLRRQHAAVAAYAVSADVLDEDKKFKLVQHGSLEADGRRARLDFEWLVPSGRMWRHVRETSGTSAGPTPRFGERSRWPGSIPAEFRRPGRATEDAWREARDGCVLSRPETSGPSTHYRLSPRRLPSIVDSVDRRIVGRRMLLAMKTFVSAIVLVAVCGIGSTQQPVRPTEPVRPGIEVFFSGVPERIRGKRIGLITNNAGIDRPVPPTSISSRRTLT